MVPVSLASAAVRISAVGLVLTVGCSDTAGAKADGGASDGGIDGSAAFESGALVRVAVVPPARTYLRLAPLGAVTPADPKQSNE